MKSRWDNVVTMTLVICALITTGLLVRREFWGAPVARAAMEEQKPVLVAHWRDHLREGALLGSAQAPVMLIEFADFECPFCAKFHDTLKAVRERYPTQVALVFMHFPLPMHRFAELAARAAECAGTQGHFEPMYDRLFAEQDSFGLKPWMEIAAEAGVPDGEAFETCIKETAPVQRIVVDREFGKQLDVSGTPTLLVNGWKLGRPPNAEELDRMVKAILAGKDPV